MVLLRAPYRRASKRLENSVAAYHPRQPNGLGLLEILPNEIWEIIALALPLSAQASLALTCRSLYLAIGSRSLPLLQQDTEERLRFLYGLDQHFPKHILCSQCAIFHVRNREFENFDGCQKPENNPCKSGALREPWDHSGQIAVRLSRTPNLSMPCQVLQLVFRANKVTEAYGMVVGALSHSHKLAHHPMDYRKNFGRYGIFLNVDSALAEDRFLMRVRMRIELDSDRGWMQERLDYISWPICDHLATAQRAHRLYYNDYIEALCHLSNVKSQNREKGIKYACHWVGRLGRCCLCPSEYQVELRAVEKIGGTSKKYELLMTRWIDFGSSTDCSNLCLIALTSQWHWRESDGKPFNMDPLKPIKTRFESHCGNIVHKEDVVLAASEPQRFFHCDTYWKWREEPVPEFF